MLYGYLYCYVIPLAGNIYRLIVKGSLVRIHVTHEIYNAALIVIFGLFFVAPFPLVYKYEGNTLVKIRKLT